MKRNIFLTESQILKIKEDINAPTYKGAYSKDDRITVNFNKDLTYKGDPSKYYDTKNRNNLVRYYKFEDGSISLSPISKKVNVRINGKLNTINVWGLGFLNDTGYNQAIKKDQMKKKTVDKKDIYVPVEWGDGGKDMLLSYCAQYAAEALPYICKYEDISTSDIGYISWPQSSSKFNHDFVKNFLVPALNNKGINISENDIIPNIVIKNRDIKIDYDIAQKVGLDDVDIKDLQGFVMSQKKVQNVLCIRQNIDNLVSQVETDIKNNKIEQFYQYTTKSKKKENDKKPDTFNTNGMYLNNVSNGNNNDDKWVKQRVNSRMTKVDLTKGRIGVTGRIKDYEIGEKFNEISKKLLSKKNEIIEIYQEAEKEASKIHDQQEITDEQGHKLNFGHYNHKYNKHNNKTTTAYKYLDSIVDSNGKTDINKAWEIKKFAEACRQVLYDLFKVNDKNKNMNYDKSKVLIIFDDNVAGGRTLASTCETLLTGENGVRWEKVIPLTLSFMHITQGDSIKDISKQKDYRDRIAAKNNYYNGDANSISDSNEKSYTIHNFGDVKLGDKYPMVDKTTTQGIQNKLTKSITESGLKQIIKETLKTFL